MKLKTLLIVGLTLMMSATMAIGLVGCGVKLEAVPAKEATCEYEGNTAYWKDPETGKCYSDEEGKNEIAESDTVIAPTGHSYADTWSSDGTNHWHQATCEHSDKLKDRAEHTYPKYTDVSKNEGFTGLELCKCTVCGYEREVTEAYQMYIVGSIASVPGCKWASAFATKADVAKNCIPMTYDAATKTFSAEVAFIKTDDFGVYNLTDGQMFPARASQSSVDALRVDARGKYIVKWTIGTWGPSVTMHDHNYSAWGFSPDEHWKVCPDDDVIDETTRAAHTIKDGVCECGYAPAACEHPNGYQFTYVKDDENNPIPTPAAEGGVLKKVCPDCFAEQEVPYDKGASKKADVALDELWYLQEVGDIRFIINTAGTYTLNFENVHHGNTVGSTATRALKTITLATGKYPTNLSGKKSVWGYMNESGWSEQSAMAAQVTQWKDKIKMNGSPLGAPEFVELQSVEITVTQEDLAAGDWYFVVSVGCGRSSAAEQNGQNACLVKLTYAAPATAKAQEVALLPEKKTLA